MWRNVGQGQHKAVSFHQIGESVIADDCTERIICQPSGIVRRESITCRSSEVCTIKYGARGCFENTNEDCTLMDGRTLKVK